MVGWTRERYERYRMKKKRERLQLTADMACDETGTWWVNIVRGTLSTLAILALAINHAKSSKR